MSNKSKPHIKSLDGLRGYAALAVCLYHGELIFGRMELIPHAYLAVDLFFVLSGFVLFYRYNNDLSGEIANQISLWDFLSQRIARLYPLYLFATIVGIFFYWLMFVIKGNLFVHLGRLSDMALNGIFMIPYLEPNITNPTRKVFPYAYQAWSIFWELIVSLTFFFTIRIGKILETAIALCSILALIVLTAHSRDIDEGWRNIHFEIGFFRAFAAFYCGVLTSRIYKTYGKFLRYEFDNWAILISAGILGLMVYYFHIHPKQEWEFELLLLYIGFPLLILSSAIASKSILKLPPFLFLGNISYSVYLLHGTATLIPLWLILHTDFVKGSMVLGWFWLGILLVLSYFTFRFIEVPMRNKLRLQLSKLGNMVSKYFKPAG